MLLTAIVEIKETEKTYERIVEVEHLKALRSMKTDGRITALEKSDDEIRGIIDSQVFFTSNVCEPSYVPELGDLVNFNFF